MNLYIDTTDFNKVTFAVSDGKKMTQRTYVIDPHESHETLGKFSQFIKTIKFKRELLKTIVVNKGPGSYTGVRIGITLGQALSFAWGVKLQPLSKGRFKIK